MNLRKPTLLLGILIFLMLACSLPTLVPTPQPLPTSSPTWTLLPQSTTAPTETLAPSEAATETLTPTGLPTGTSTPEGPTATEFVCPNAPITRMKIGDAARVTFTDGTPLRVRKKPIVGEDNIIIQIPEGTPITVFDGPVCAPIPDTGRAFVFWRIEIDSSGQDGWVAEGDSGSYYIEPVR